MPTITKRPTTTTTATRFEHNRNDDAEHVHGIARDQRHDNGKDGSDNGQQGGDEDDGKYGNDGDINTHIDERQGRGGARLDNSGGDRRENGAGA